MSVDELYTLYAIDFASPSATQVSQLQNASATGGLEVRRAKSAGAAFADFATIDRGAPGIAATTTDIKSILDLCLASGGNGFTANTSGGNVVLTMQKVVEFATRSTSADNLTFTAADSLLSWSSINAGHTEVANCDFGLAIPSDGTNPPISYSGTASLGGTPAGDSQWVLGKVEINTTALKGVRNVSIQSGVSLFTAGDESIPWPTFAAVNMISPIINIEMSDVAEWSNWDFSGVSGAGGALDGLNGIEIFLRKKAQDGTLVAEATLEHIKIQATDGIVSVDTAQSSGADSGSLRLAVSPRSTDTTTSPFTINTAIAIT